MTLLTTQPNGLASRADVGGMTVRYVRTPHPFGRRPGYGLDATAMFATTAFAGSAIAKADIIHCWHYADAAAVLRRGRPLVWKVTGSVTPQWMRKSPMHLRMFERALARCDDVMCNSEWARQEMTGFGKDMHIVPAGVDRELFQPVADRAAVPTVLSTSAPEEPRKRLVDLFTAWPAIRAAVPTAVLRVAGTAGDKTRESLLDLVPTEHRESVSFLGPIASKELAVEYSAAWLTVAPAVLEALGLTSVESLACGTPVVGADSGHTSFLLAEPGLGRVFTAADPADLARAVVAQLAATDAADRSAIRASTRRYDWAQVVDDVEATYHRLLAR